MPKLLIIADDFTGAVNTGVQLAKKCISTLISLIGMSEFLDKIKRI